jgi:uncharacterized protein YndB with AHSA1/START domain
MARNETYIAAPPERVYAVLADARSYGEWVVGSKEIRDADPAFPAPGARLHHSVGFGPLVIKDHTEVLESDPPRRLKLKARALPLGKATVTLDLAPDGSGTRLTMVEDPSGHTASLRWFPPMQLFTRLRNTESLRRLKVLAERPA